MELSLANDSSQPHDYELRPPADSGLAVAPQIGTLAAGASVRVVVSFTAPQRSASVEAAGELAAESADVEEASPASGDGGEDAEGGGDGGDGGGSEGLADEGPDEATHPEAVEPQRGPPASDEMVVRVAALLNRELERLAVDPSKRSWFKLFKQAGQRWLGANSAAPRPHLGCTSATSRLHLGPLATGRCGWLRPNLLR